MQYRPVTMYVMTRTIYDRIDSILQGYSYTLWQGFKDEDLGNSAGWWATSVPTVQSDPSNF